MNIIAIVLSIMACTISLYEANIMNVQQKAMVWPHLQLQDNFNAAGYSVIASNNGVGPCIIKSMEVTYNGLPIASYYTFLNQVDEKQSVGYDKIKVNKLNKTVLKNGEERLLFQIKIDSSTERIVSEFRKLNFKISYASVLDENWYLDKEKGEIHSTEFIADLEFKN